MIYLFVSYWSGEKLLSIDLCETTFDECGSRNVECGRVESLRSVFF
jgi:hypothetical protein